jgi:hypothetical protein
MVYCGLRRVTYFRFERSKNEKLTGLMTKRPGFLGIRRYSNV